MNFLSDSSDIFERIKNAKKDNLLIETEGIKESIQYKNYYFTLFKDHVNVLSHDFQLLNRVDRVEDNFIASEFLVTNITPEKLTKVNLLTGQESSFKIEQVCQTPAPSVNVYSLKNGFLKISIICDPKIWNESDEYQEFTLVYDISGNYYKKISLLKRMNHININTCLNRENDSICFIFNNFEESVKIVKTSGETLKVLKNIKSFSSVFTFSEYYVLDHYNERFTFITLNSFEYFKTIDYNYMSNKIISLDNDDYLYVKRSKNTDNGHYDIPWSPFGQTGTFPYYGQHRFIPGTGITSYTHSIIGRNIQSYNSFESLIEIKSTNDEIESDKQTVVGLFKCGEKQIVILRENNSQLWTFK